MWTRGTQSHWLSWEKQLVGKLGEAVGEGQTVTLASVKSPVPVNSRAKDVARSATLSHKQHYTVKGKCVDNLIGGKGMLSGQWTE